MLERAGDIVEEDDKEKLQGFGSKIQDARQGSVNSVNNWIGAPDDPEAKKLVPNQMDDVEQLVDDLIHYVDVPDNMNAMKVGGRTGAAVGVLHRRRGVGAVM